MTPASPLSAGRAPRWRRWAIIIGVWAAFGLVASAQHHISSSLSRGVDLPWSISFRLQLPVAMIWALATPGIQWLGRRFPIDRDHWATSLPIHAVACAGFIFALVLGYVVHTNLVLPPPTPVPVLERSLQLFVAWTLTDAVLYATVLSVTYAGDRQRRLRERELQASQLETDLVQSELRALKMQLQPHFLFNALHTIGALVRTGDRDNALRVVTSLGDLLRRVVDGAADQEVSLDQELGLARSYLAIEAVRFRDRLTVDVEVDPAAERALVPHLILQPLVENAIRHGIEPNPGAGRLAIQVRRDNGRLVLTVRDDGPGAGPPSGPGRAGVGLANTRARLGRLYPGQADLTVGPAPGGGHQATVSLPFREGAAAGRSPA